ncbi:MAG: GNAT family N-acetyltransferase [Candidatus Nealsonbacteria bacterium]|nr:GNAT family N-acetyltransferase [Candidatus Nealsonbacteria bacterium]
MRDIPAQSIEAGSKISNLGQIITQESLQEEWKCNCIRCREIKEDYNPKEKLTIFRKDYLASGGTEIFLSFEDQKNKNIYSLLRLRINDKDPDINALKNVAIIREIHTYGQQVSIKNDGNNSPQHKGLGKALINKAEEIAHSEFGKKKIAVISATGTRNYYRKLGYRLKDTYMIKTISAS